MKKLFQVTVCLMFFMAAATAQAQMKIGYINSAELITQMPETEQAKKDMEKMGIELKQNYDVYVEEYESKVADYQANSKTWPAAKKELKEGEILRLQQEIAQLEVDLQQQAAEAEQKMLQPILDKAEKAIEAVGAAGKFTYIVDVSTGAFVYLGDDAINILNDVKKHLGIQ